MRRPSPPGSPSKKQRGSTYLVSPLGSGRALRQRRRPRGALTTHGPIRDRSKRDVRSALGSIGRQPAEDRQRRRRGCGACTKVTAAGELQRVATRLRVHVEGQQPAPEARSGHFGDARPQLDLMLDEVLVGDREDLAHHTAVLRALLQSVDQLRSGRLRPDLLSWRHPHRYAESA